MLWCLNGEPLVIAFGWVAHKLGMSVRAVLWIVAGVLSGIGWAVYQFLPKLEALCSMACL